MRSRDPLLYEQLIGQYQTPAEKRADRRPDARTDTLVDVLLEGIDHDLNKAEEKRQREEEETMIQNEDDESQQPETPMSNDDEESSDSNHDQWGNFDEPSTAQPRPARKRPAKLITAGERDLLREELLGIMYSNFLSGKDAEFFDYSEIDSNEAYDDTLETEQDCEDKYFEDDSQSPPAQQIINDDSEDALDTYMKHLEGHLKQQSDTFEEEFDD